MDTRISTLLSSITRIATVIAALFCFPFGIRENEEIPSAFGTTNTHSQSDSASESASADDTASIYEVFLSFCGKDTRKGFTDFLYTLLIKSNIQTFRDDKQLRVGKVISTDLLEAIKSSKISIPIFSKNYASSRWCLLELEQMVECYKNGDHVIFPIFYNVDPSDVRNQTGSYEKAFRDHASKEDGEMVRRWSDALNIVGYLKGLELKKETNGKEGELVKIVVEEVLLKLRKNYTHVPEILVGIDKHVERLEGLLEVDSIGLRIIGIYGMGGIGKTTISRVTYNKVFEHFESCCFLEDIRENSKNRNDTVRLQKQLISKLQNMEAPEISDFSEGSKKIKDAIRGKKVLIVLDDVDEFSQVHMLIGHPNWFSARSRIIITTREKCVLDQIETTCEREGLLDVYRSYKAEFMDNSDAFKLFCNYAFKTDFPLEIYERHSKEVVFIAAGLPLVLVVLGSMLSSLEGPDSWEVELEKLRAIQHKDILKILRISFDALEYDQKQIYLDIAVYFSGSDVTRPSYMWYDCGFYPRVELRVLVSKSLITIDDDNRVIMHDQLIDLGKEIVRKERELGKQSRFWKKEESRHAILTNQGTKFVTAIQLCSGYEDSEPIPASYFCDVPNIRFLDLWHQQLDGDFKGLLSNLRWLRWRFSGKFMPTILHMENLVILDLDLSDSVFTEDKDIWSQIKVGKKLKVFNLSFSPNLSVPSHISTYASLEIFNISNCKSVCKLDGLEQLEMLKYVGLSFCSNLESLPNLSNLKKLVFLEIQFCSKLVEIQGLEKLGLLQTLNANGCRNLIKMEGLHTLNSLKDLDLEDCISLVGELDFSEMKKLKRINVHGCQELTSVKGLDMLNFLEHLNLSQCSFKGVLDLSNLKNLQQLFAPELEVTNIRNSNKLNKLSISYNNNVLDLQYLDQLELLWIDGFNVCVGSMKKFVDQIMDLSCLKRMKNFQLYRFLYIEELPSLSNLRKLEVFYLSQCEKLVHVQGLQWAECLRDLFIDSCNSLTRLDLPTFGVLESITVISCNSLYEIEGIRGVAFLKNLSIFDCPKLKEIGDLRILESLISLTLHCNEELTGIPGLDNLTSLKLLRITGCESIETLPDLSRLKRLRKLDTDGCVKLSKISGLEELQALENLDVRGCDQLGVLPDLPNITVLRGPLENRR